jgi:penicillin-binding protein 2
MTEFKDTQQQLSKFRLRVAAAGLFVFVCFGLIGFRFLFLQVWHYSKYSLQADENRISVAPIVPNRGIITDRNGVVLAKNYSAYTLELTPSKLNDSLETAGRLEELREPADPHPPDRRRSRALHRAALPVSRRGSARAPVPPISARADRGARDRLHRPDFAARSGPYR